MRKPETSRIPNGSLITFDDADWVGVVVGQTGNLDPEKVEVLVTLPGYRYGWIKRSDIARRHVRGLLPFSAQATSLLKGRNVK